MTYLRLLKLVDRLVARLMKHADHDKAWWSWVAYYHGHIAMLQIDYIDRVKKLGGWEPVEVITDDWVQDSSLTVDETMRRFHALNPEWTVGPNTWTTGGATFTYTSRYR